MSGVLLALGNTLGLADQFKIFNEAVIVLIVEMSL